MFFSSRKHLSVPPLIYLENATEASCKITVELYLPREKDPDDCIKYVWIYIIWRSNQNVNFTTGNKTIGYMCWGPAALLGPPPSEAHGHWNGSSCERGAECSLMSSPLVGACRTFKLFQMLPFPICGISLF